MLTCPVACFVAVSDIQAACLESHTMAWTDEGVAGWKAETNQLERKVPTLELPRMCFRFFDDHRSCWVSQSLLLNHSALQSCSDGLDLSIS
jgi:hypothetical protein